MERPNSHQQGRMLHAIQHMLMIRLLGLEGQRGIDVVLMSEGLLMHEGV